MNLIFMHMALLGDTWVIGLLIVASVVSIGVMFERWMVYRKNRGDVATLMDSLAESLEQSRHPRGLGPGGKQQEGGSPGGPGGLEELFQGRGGGGRGHGFPLAEGKAGT